MTKTYNYLTDIPRYTDSKKTLLELVKFVEKLTDSEEDSIKKFFVEIYINSEGFDQLDFKDSYKEYRNTIIRLDEEFLKFIGIENLKEFDLEKKDVTKNIVDLRNAYTKLLSLAAERGRTLTELNTEIIEKYISLSDDEIDSILYEDYYKLLSTTNNSILKKNEQIFKTYFYKAFRNYLTRMYKNNLKKESYKKDTHQSYIIDMFRNKQKEKLKKGGKL